MPKALDPAQRTTVTSMLSQRVPHKQIAVAAGCSLSQVKRMSQNMRKFGKPNKPKVKIQGRPRTLAPEVIEGLVEYFRGHPFAQLGELVTYVNSTFNITTTRSTVSRTLKRANLDRNTLQTIASEQQQFVPVILDSGGSVPLTVLVNLSSN